MNLYGSLWISKNLNLNSTLFFLAGELGNAVQDAFVIAVEQQARERLQRLSALKRITPVDMSQLSIKVLPINFNPTTLVYPSSFLLFFFCS